MSRLTTDRNDAGAVSFDQLTRRASTEMQSDADLGAMDFGLTLIRASNRLQQDLEGHVHRPAGLTWAAFRVLFVIRSTGDTSPREIARLSSISAASASSVLNTLERYGMIRRERDRTDGRGVTLALTEEGQSAVRELFIRNNDRTKLWAEYYSESELATLTNLLHRLLDVRTPAAPIKGHGLPPIRAAHHSKSSD